jgi:hypothetical protein
VVSDKTFVTILQTTPLLPVAIADGIGVSIPTVLLWKDGKNLPMQPLREPILRYIAHHTPHEHQHDGETKLHRVHYKDIAR